MSTAAYDAVIVGAGIIGVACADEFTRRGLRVVISDKGDIASGATGAAMGHIVVMDDSEAQFALTRYSQELWKKLRPELPDDVEYEQRGTIWIATDAEEMALVHRKHNYYSARGVPTRVLSSHQLAELEPNLQVGLPGGLLVPEDIVLSPSSAARFLFKRAQTRGADVRFGRAITHLGDQKVQFADGTELSAKIIVNAAGIGAAELTAGIEIRKRKGHLALTSAYPGYIRHQLVELAYLKSAHSASADSVAFNVQPRRNGQALIGSSRQYGAQSGEVEDAILSRMFQQAEKYLPGIRGLTIQRSWTGFRAATPDRLPFIGPSSEDASVFLATGHEGLGITTSLATAKLLADYIEGTKTEIPIEPYLPSRLTQGVPGGH